MPDMYPGALSQSIIGDALKRGIWSLNVIDLRTFGVGNHLQVDDTPYGGGAGMVIKPDVVDSAILHAQKSNPDAQIVHFSPRGEVLTQRHLVEFSQTPITMICGRYEGIDQRVLDTHHVREISLGDFVMTGGDYAAMVLIDGCVRLLPDVIGDAASLGEESFGLHERYAHLLEYPLYTKPAVWNTVAVPEVLTSGHHANIDAWRLAQAEAITKARRPDLWARYREKFPEIINKKRR
jgi:tRNA (guanine37-N1)-methyltransferase